MAVFHSSVSATGLWNIESICYLEFLFSRNFLIVFFFFFLNYSNVKKTLEQKFRYFPRTEMSNKFAYCYELDLSSRKSVFLFHHVLEFEVKKNDKKHLQMWSKKFVWFHKFCLDPLNGEVEWQNSGIRGVAVRKKHRYVFVGDSNLFLRVRFTLAWHFYCEENSRRL